MKYNETKGVSISELSLGTVQLGVSYGINNQSGKPDRTQAFGILDTALTNGISALDTAAAYGDSEQVIGQWLQTIPEEKRPFITTKLKALDHSGLDALRRSVNAQLEHSMQQLGLSCIPCLMLHNFDEYDCDRENMRVVFDELKMTDAQLVGFNKIMITACGSAFYAGQAGKYALEKLTHIPVDADLASEFRYRDPIVDEHTLMIIISQSGETADTIAAIREAQSKGAYVLSIVNVVGSTIARISDDVIYTWAGPEIAVATTKGYTTQVSVLYLLALYLGEKRGCLSREEAAKLTDDLMILPQMVQRAIDLNPQIAQLAERYKNNPSLFFIGRNVDYAVCMEGSLKLKEISYLHSEAYAAGELKHGTIALIEENRLVIAVACYEPLFDKTMSNVKEVKARGARVLGVALEGNRAIYSEADDVILVPRMDDLFVVPAEIVPLQLFAYYVAKANGCAIDKPKNLAKSVTVE